MFEAALFDLDGTRDYARAALDALGVSALLSVLVIAEDVTNGKPDPEG